MNKDFKLEKTDIVVLFSEIDHKYVDENLFKAIVDLEKDKFGSSLIRDRNPANQIFQLTLAQSKVIIQLIGTKLIISDSSGEVPGNSDLIKRYFTSVYYPIINTVPCKTSAFGFNFTGILKDEDNKIDLATGIDKLESNLGVEVSSFNNTYTIGEEDKKLNLFINKLGNQKRIQLNIHFDDTKPLENSDNMEKKYIEGWDIAKKLFPKLKG